jgi:two-component system OmpR family sensor kinase
MTHSRTSRVSALAGRLLRAQLRLKVLAGVVVVTLVALVAFDLAAVSTARRDLLSQTDSDLQGALTLTLPRLAAITGARWEVDNVLSPHETPVRFPPGSAQDSNIPALGGAYDMAFLPVNGGQQTLQVAATAATGGLSWTLSRNQAKIAARPGPHILFSPNGRGEIRAVTLSVPGGALIAGISLDQVDETIVQVELIVIWGSIAVVLLIGLGVFVVLRRGLRPIEAMAEQADRITAGDLTDRVTPHDPGTEVGRLGTP